MIQGLRFFIFSSDALHHYAYNCGSGENIARASEADEGMYPLCLSCKSDPNKPGMIK